ncbi:hypothetical protein, partial [Sphingobacterium sp. UBA7855]|uniref:hypothetical protein n=1 Tax=Sphingobacterium sp. UBA7855 TaxID=1947526 RepID=UPI0025EF6415
FHFGHNSLEGWEIIFGKQSPGAEFKGQIADKRCSGWGSGAAGTAGLNGLPNAKYRRPIEATKTLSYYSLV